MSPSLLRPRRRGRVLYFDGGVDADWSTLGNWSTAGGPAATLPGRDDRVIVRATIASNGGSLPAVNSLDVPDAGGDGHALGIAVVVQGVATFAGLAVLSGTITGNAQFIATSRHEGAVIGRATFADAACNAGGTAGTFVPNPPPSC